MRRLTGTIGKPLNSVDVHALLETGDALSGADGVDHAIALDARSIQQAPHSIASEMPTDPECRRQSLLLSCSCLTSAVRWARRISAIAQPERMSSNVDAGGQARRPTFKPPSVELTANGHSPPCAHQE
jgi:hypothetical protein